jgi:hypothetical protein
MCQNRVHPYVSMSRWHCRTCIASCIYRLELVAFALKDPVVWVLKRFTVSLNNYENKIVIRRLSEVKDSSGWAVDIQILSLCYRNLIIIHALRKNNTINVNSNRRFLCKTASKKTSGKYGSFSMKYFAYLTVLHLVSPFDVYPISQLSNREIAL